MPHTSDNLDGDFNLTGWQIIIGMHVYNTTYYICRAIIIITAYGV